MRRSPLLAASILAVGLLGIPSWWLSDAPRGLAIVAALAGLVWALILARREFARAGVAIVLQSSGSSSVDGEVVDSLQVSWRGPLTAIAWRSRGRIFRRLVLTDAIDTAARRDLRLWALRRRDDTPPAAVAP